MRIPSFTRLSEQDFQDPENLTPLASNLNRPLDTLTSALQNQLTFNDNFLCAIKEIELDGVYPKSFVYSLKTRPRNILVTGYDKSSLITASPFVIWELNNKQIKITNVFGINPTASDKLKLTLLIF